MQFVRESSAEMAGLTETLGSNGPPRQGKMMSCFSNVSHGANNIQLAAICTDRMHRDERRRTETTMMRIKVPQNEQGKEREYNREEREDEES